MNPSTASPYQNLANTCVVIAAIIYLWPLQNLLWEFAHKSNDSAGGLDWLRFSRPALHTLTTIATPAMAIVSLLFMDMTPGSGMLERIAACAPIYLLPPLRKRLRRRSDVEA